MTKRFKYIGDMISEIIQKFQNTVGDMVSAKILRKVLMHELQIVATVKE